jgi:predicted DsbA family dithiol-disulfide isomerase
MADPKILEIFSDYIWPWCYFSTVRIERLQKEFDVEVFWRAFPLHPDTPEDGLRLEELYAGRLIDIESVRSRLKLVADQLALPLGDRKKTYNSRRAQELAKWAESKGKGDLFHDAVFRAYFVEGKNIGDPEILITLAKSIGLADEEARSVLQSRKFKDAVDGDWSRSYSLGITGVPTLVIGREALVGFQPYEASEEFLKTNGVKKRVS